MKDLHQNILNTLLQTPGLSSVDVGPGRGMLWVDDRYHRFAFYVEMLMKVGRRFQKINDDRNLLLVVVMEPTDYVSITYPKSNDFSLEINCPAIFYLNPSETFLIDADEEYRKIISIHKRINVLYRSWRSKEFSDNGWEFANDIFVTYSGS